MDELQRHYAVWNKSVTKYHVLYETYISYLYEMCRSGKSVVAEGGFVIA